MRKLWNYTIQHDPITISIDKVKVISMVSHLDCRSMMKRW